MEKCSYPTGSCVCAAAFNVRIRALVVELDDMRGARSASQLGQIIAMRDAEIRELRAQLASQPDCSCRGADRDDGLHESSCSTNDAGAES